MNMAGTSFTQERCLDATAANSSVIAKQTLSDLHMSSQDWPLSQCSNDQMAYAKEVVHAQNTPMGHRRQPSVGLGIVTDLEEIHNDNRKSKNDAFFSRVMDLPRPPPSLVRHASPSDIEPLASPVQSARAEILIEQHGTHLENVDIHSFPVEKITPLPSPAQSNVNTTFLAVHTFPKHRVISLPVTTENPSSSTSTSIPVIAFSPLPPGKANHIPSLSEQPILGDVDEQQQTLAKDLLTVPIIRELKFSSPTLPRCTEEDLIGKLIWKFQIQKLLGVGAFSKVYLADDIESGKQYAIKMISKERMVNDLRVKTSIEREVEILKYIDHPSIIRLEATMETDQYLCIVLEYVEGGELFDYVQKMHYTAQDPLHTRTEQDVKELFFQIVQVVKWMHEHNIVHRDIKLENILLQEDAYGNLRVKLTDFGLARVVDPTAPQLTTRCGSEEYAAPEIVQSRAYDGRQTDTWSLGVVLYALLVGYLPFTYNPSRGEKISHMFHRIVCADIKWPFPKDTSILVNDNAKRVVERMLVRQPEKRIGLHDVEKLPWFADVFTHTK